jgi:hypothetical protein
MHAIEDKPRIEESFVNKKLLFSTKMQINLVISIKSSNFAGHFGVKCIRSIKNKAN